MICLPLLALCLIQVDHGLVLRAHGLAIYRDSIESGDLKLALKNLLEEWLDTDERWGGHRAANEMRYMQRSGGGWFGEIAEAVSVPTGALAVISWRSAGASATDVRSQQLVLVRSPSAKGVQVLRNLKRPFAGDGGAPPAKRLIVWQERLMLFDGGTFSTLDLHGKIKGKVGTVDSKFYIRGVIRNRYPILAADDDGPFEVDGFDLAKGKAFTLFRRYDASPVSYTLDEVGRDEVTIERFNGARMTTQKILVGVPSGKITLGPMRHG